MKILYAIIGLLVAAFLWWTISPLFINTEVQEDLAVDIPADDIGERPNEDVETGTEQINAGVQDTEINVRTEVESTTIEDPRTKTREEVKSSEIRTESQVNAAPEEQTELLRASFTPSETRYNISGQVFISGSDLSLANFDSKAAPDARVYLANDKNGNDFVDLGALKGNRGNQNYSIPSGIDASDYKYVVIWCRAFSVFMGSAELQ